MGTPDFALTALKGLVLEHDVLCVYSQPPKPKGRGYKLTPSPVHEFAESLGIEVRTPKTLRNQDEQDYFKSLNLDFSVVVAYGLLLPKPILDAPKRGCVNIHGSLLPRWRGASPIQRAILAGDFETGITIMQMDEGMDDGDMLLKKNIPLDSKSRTDKLFDDLAVLGKEAILEYLKIFETITPQKQDESLVTLAPKIKKEEGLLNWNESAEFLERKIRAFSPWPGTYFEWRGENFKVLEAHVVDSFSKNPGEFSKQNLAIQTANQALEILRIQRPNHKPMPTEELLKGFSFIEQEGCLEHS